MLSYETPMRPKRYEFYTKAVIMIIDGFSGNLRDEMKLRKKRLSIDCCDSLN